MPTRKKSTKSHTQPMASSSSPSSKKGTALESDVFSESNVKRFEDLESRYTNDLGEPTLDSRLGSHPNRNTNKPQIDKPRYS